MSYEIKLYTKASSYQWFREDGVGEPVPVSPLFSTQEAALYMPGKIPFLTDEEWITHHVHPSSTPDHSPVCSPASHPLV